MGNGNLTTTGGSKPTWSTPNPSWGTGTWPPPHHKQAPIQLLTPHGERERGPQSGPCRMGWLLTPHGERERRRWWRRSCGGAPPNPSWGTGTVAPLIDRGLTKELLTPHGERERVDVQADRLIQALLLTPHGERELRFLVRPRAKALSLLTPHGEREHRYRRRFCTFQTDS